FNILNKWNSLTHSAMDDDITIKHYSDMSTFITQFLQQFSYISIVCIGAYFVTQEGTLTMGSLIAMTILSGRILQPIAQLPNHFVQWGKAKLAVKDLDNIYQLPTDNEGVERPLNPHLHTKDLLCNDVEFGYSENQSVVKLANLSIKQGEKVAILGVIGSGKSTLLKLLAGLYRPRNGFVYLNGLDTQLLKRDLLNDTVGYLPQNTKLFAGTLRDNLTFGMVGIDDEKIIEASQLTGLIALINALPNGLDTAVPEGGESVSGGQKQLIALTRLLIANRDIWLLDEPTASMDEATERQMIAMLKQKLTQEQTMIVVTHKPIVLNMVDRIIVLTPKGIAIDGSKEEVLSQLAQNAAKKVVQ
ncbi:MAG: ATP-binding cassette domain-containing protein, partial [Arcobacteraceae bacterium]|nr:ATP-binding cassette domain-containing protein [Arcobacteraceae bacterium]